MFSKYLNEIWRIELISALEEVELAQRIKEWDQKALDKLVESNLRFVVSVAKQYENKWLSLPDLINEGNYWLIKAAKRFDETRGFKFTTYAVWWIRQSILQALTNISKFVRLPANQILQINKVKKAKERLEQDFCREPSDAELAEFMDVEEEYIQKIQSNILHVTSLDTPINASDTDQGTYIDTIYNKNEKDAPDYGLYTESLQKDIEKILYTLRPKEKDVIVFYYWLCWKRALTLEEIAEHFDCSRERVRQIKDTAMRKLKQINRAKNLKQYL